MKIDLPYIRVWSAGEKLTALLPPATEAPFHGDYHNDIDTVWVKGLEYVTCMSCQWHTDWREIFEYVVARGVGTLFVGVNEYTGEGVCYDDPEKFRRIKIERGDCIQLWPMHSHRVTCRGSMALLSNDVHRSNEDRTFKGFRSTEKHETYFANYIRKNRRKR